MPQTFYEKNIDSLNSILSRYGSKLDSWSGKAREKVHFTCACGEKYSIMSHHILSGRDMPMCPKCRASLRGKKRSQSAHLSEEAIRALVESFGATFLKEEGSGFLSQAHFICPKCQKESSIKYNNLLKRKANKPLLCPSCARKRSVVEPAPSDLLSPEDNRLLLSNYLLRIGQTLTEEHDSWCVYPIIPASVCLKFNRPDLVASFDNQILLHISVCNLLSTDRICGYPEFSSFKNLYNLLQEIRTKAFSTETAEEFTALTKELSSFKLVSLKSDYNRDLKPLSSLSRGEHSLYKKAREFFLINEYTFSEEGLGTLFSEGVLYFYSDYKEHEAFKQKVLSLRGIDYTRLVDTWVKKTKDFPSFKVSPEALSKDFARLKTGQNENVIGFPIIKHFHTSIYDCCVAGYLSPRDAWSDEALRRRVIENRITYKGIAKLSPLNILRGFKISNLNSIISLFMPVRARILLETYAEGIPHVVDPFSGFSGRLLGSIACGKTYTGWDINPTTVEESNEIIQHFNLSSRASVSVRDVFNTSPQTYQDSVLLTCPPYALKETWCQEIRNLTCDQWIDAVLSRFICDKYVFVVDVTDKYARFIKSTISNSNHFAKAIGSDPSEKVIVFTRAEAETFLN